MILIGRKQRQWVTYFLDAAEQALGISSYTLGLVDYGIITDTLSSVQVRHFPGANLKFMEQINTYIDFKYIT